MTLRKYWLFLDKMLINQLNTATIYLFEATLQRLLKIINRILEKYYF